MVTIKFIETIVILDAVVSCGKVVFQSGAYAKSVGRLNGASSFTTTISSSGGTVPVPFGLTPARKRIFAEVSC